MPRLAASTAVFVSALAFAAPAGAQTAVGVVSGRTADTLVKFDTAAPGSVTASKPVRGLVGDERLVGIDYRWLPIAPATPGLYGLGRDAATGDAHVYRIDPDTGVATPATTTLSVAAADDFGFDFNPTVDRIRLASSADLNVRLHPDTGALAATDSTITPAGNKIGAAAYDRVNLAPTTPATAANTTLYVIDPTADRLATIGGINSTPSPNGGVLSAVGPLGVDASDRDANFDIAPSGEAAATLTVGGVPRLYAINLTTGAAALVGDLPAELSGFAFVPAPPVVPTPTPAPTPTPVPTPAPDTKAPVVKLTGKTSLSRTALLKGLKVTASPNEAAALEFSVNGIVRRVSAARALAGKYNLQLAGRTLPRATGPRSVTLKPKAALVPKLRTSQKVQVRVTATDAAGNASTTTRTITVKR